jgi:thiol-disulfide isomerase/thioredoxin
MRIFIILILFLSFLSAFAEEIFYDLEGSKVSYREIISTSPNTVILLWTSWCPYCRLTLLHLNKEIDKKCIYFNDVNLFYINLGESKRKIKRFIEKNKIKKCIEKNILLDKKNILAKKFSISGIPTFIFLKNGIPVYRSFFISKELLKKIFKNE